MLHRKRASFSMKLKLTPNCLQVTWWIRSCIFSRGCPDFSTLGHCDTAPGKVTVPCLVGDEGGAKAFAPLVAPSSRWPLACPGSDFGKGVMPARVAWAASQHPKERDATLLSVKINLHFFLMAKVFANLCLSRGVGTKKEKTQMGPDMCQIHELF